MLYQYHCACCNKVVSSTEKNALLAALTPFGALSGSGCFVSLHARQ